jgi:phage gp37-like protein
MLGELEDLIQRRLEELREQNRQIAVDTYGGELGDPDLLAGLLKRCPALLLTTPKAVFRKRSQGRYSVAITFRLVIATRSARDERTTRRGTGRDIGSYDLWSACMAKLVDWQPWPDRALVVPTDLANLVNGKLQADYLSVLGQSFAIELDWEKPTENLPDLLGIDMHYHVPPGSPEAVAIDIIDLENT